MSDAPALFLEQNQERWPNLRRFGMFGGDNPVNTAGNIRERALNEAGELQFLNPTIKFGVDLSIAYLQGDNGLQPQAKINPAAVGLTPKQAEALGDQFENLFREWSSSPMASADDAADFPSLMQPALRRAFGTGELLLSVGWRNYPTRWSTCVKPLDPQRIARWGGSQQLPKQGNRVIQGVEIDDISGRVDALWIRGNMPAYGFTQTEVYRGVGERIEVKSPFGRPQLIFEIIDKLGPGVVRGVSPILSAIERTVRLDDLTDATLEQVMAQLQVAWSLVSDLSMSEANAAVFGDAEQRKRLAESYLDTLDAHLAHLPLNVPKGAKISFLPMGAKLAATNPSLPGLGLEATQRRLYLEISRALNVSYADLTSDFASETFSSSRLGQVGPWAIVKQRRHSFVAPTYSQIYGAVIEEALLKGYVKLPRNAKPFYGFREAYTAVDWTGPARPIVDPEKEANANDIALANGSTSLEEIASEQGKDWRELIDQRVREIEYCRQAGVPMIAGGVDLTTGQAVSGNTKAPSPANDKEMKNAA